MIESVDVPKTDFSQWIAFTGEISLGDNRTAINFQARIDETGEVEYQFERMTLNNQLRFIYHTHDNQGSRFEQFSLRGLSEGGVQLETDNLIFTAMNSSFGELEGDWFQPTASSSVSNFSAPLSIISDLPMMTSRLRGFQGFYPLTVECALGTISMIGPKELDNPQLVSGALQIKATKSPSDVLEWKVKADALLDHVRRVMSFSSSAILSAPIREFYGASDVEIIAYSQTTQSVSPMRITHFLNQQPFFEAAVTSFFCPPIQVKNLFYAIEWFAMDAKFNEVRLINAMTVIENLVASNLDESTSQILPKNEFKKAKTVLRDAYTEFINFKYSANGELTKKLVKNFDEKLNDLNRCSIIDKLNALIQQWKVPLDGISDKQIEAAKKARDLIVHRGHYYDEDGHPKGELWDHFTLIRELVVRILFTALGYRGQYISYVGGTKHVNFPPDSGH
ncbi:hypothetical protein [Undibacterium sp. Di24W]|uniref:hypothetical protein n=1 Tax=Undibacterium sp. Di24W TaxID=3413033 RepID=UPI003BEF5777